MNIHITLVGGQTAPVYQGIIYTNPEFVYLIHSEETIDQANRLKNEISIPTELIQFDPVSFDKIYQSIQSLLSRINEEDRVSLNLSSGTKPWSIFFFDQFKNRNHIQLFYIDQNANIWDFSTLKCSKIPFDMEAQFRLYGNPLEHYTPLNAFTKQDIVVIKQIKEIRTFNYIDFNQLTDSIGRHPNQTSHILPSLSEINFDNEEQSITLKLVRNNNVKKVKLTSPNVFKLVTFAGWFEVEIAFIISNLKNINDIRLNCKFPATNNAPKNEIDIIVQIGTKLLFVECKTKLTNITDIDKFSNAVRVYGGTASKAILISESPLSEIAQEKCKENGVMYFSFNNNKENDRLQLLLTHLIENQLTTLNPN